MQVSIENTGNLQRKLTVKIPAERLAASIQGRMQEVGKNVRIKGFRAGKVPVKVIEQRYGAQVRNEALSDLIGDTFQEAVRQEKLRPAVAPSISTKQGDAAGEIEYTATFEVLPELDKIDVSKIELLRPVADIQESDIDGMVETLRSQRRQWNTVDRVSGKDDLVLFEYSAQASDERYPPIGNERAGTIIGSLAMFADFEAILTAVKVDDTVEKELDFPADFRVQALAGKKAQVSLKVLRVQEAQLPEVNDEFIADFGIRKGGIEKFRADVRSNLERELTSAIAARTKTRVVEALVSLFANVEVPVGMIESETRNLQHRYKEHVQRTQGADAAVPELDSFKDDARKRSLTGILLGEIAQQNALTLDSRRVADALSAIASTYDDPEAVVKVYRQDDRLMSGLRSMVMEDQVIDWVANNAASKEEKLTFAQAMAPASAA